MYFLQFQYTTDIRFKKSVHYEIQRDLLGGDGLNQYCMNSSGKGLNVIDFHLYVNIQQRFKALIIAGFYALTFTVNQIIANRLSDSKPDPLRQWFPTLSACDPFLNQ